MIVKYRLRTWIIVLTFSSVTVSGLARQMIGRQAVLLNQGANLVTLSNGYFDLEFDRVSHRIIRVAADHTGGGRFDKNLLSAEGIQFDTATNAAEATAQLDVVLRTPSRVIVRLIWSSETVTLSLGASDRDAKIQIACAISAKSCGNVSLSLQQWFLLGVFDRGVVQYIAGQDQSFTSHEPLQVFYTIDRDNGSIAIKPETPSQIAETTLVSTESPHTSGIALHLGRSNATVDQWASLTSEHPIFASSIADRPHIFNFFLYANDLPFPAYRSENKITGEDGTEDRDSDAYFTAVYGSAAGVLGSYAEGGSGYPTLSTPKRSYGTGFDFFDPDAWEIVTPLSYSGDPLLQNEARKILERSEAGMLPDGQVPHHFQNGVPVYLSIAKSKQTGPNLFWTLAALEYASATGNEAWLRAHYSHLQIATEWILRQFDPDEQLLKVEGPLFIDVFKRSGYTLDTNAVTILLMERMAEAADFNHDQAAKTRYLDFASKLKIGLNRHLWDSSDHFVTQQNADGSRRDLVDYDGNFAALALGVLPDRADEEKLLHRLDSGQHTHPDGRGTWVSEKPYLKDDCYGGNIGDSNVAMARIWWFDMNARVRLNDHTMFDTTLQNVEGDLLKNTWMSERYNAAGMPAHNPYYHEYPEVVSMVLRELRYGVHIGMRDVQVKPFGVNRFNMHLGTLQVNYSPERISIQVPGTSERHFLIGGLPPHSTYTLSGGKILHTDESGWLSFQARAGTLIQIRQVNVR